MSENSYCDTSLIFLKSINKNIAKNLIIKNHYTHKWTLCTVAYGVYYKEYVESTFFGGFNAKLIGVLVYGNIGHVAAIQGQYARHQVLAFICEIYYGIGGESNRDVAGARDVTVQLKTTRVCVHDDICGDSVNVIDLIDGDVRIVLNLTACARNVKVIRICSVGDVYGDDDGHGGIGRHAKRVRVFKVWIDGPSALDGFCCARPITKGGHRTGSQLEPRIQRVKSSSREL